MRSCDRLTDEWKLKNVEIPCDELGRIDDRAHRPRVFLVIELSLPSIPEALFDECAPPPGKDRADRIRVFKTALDYSFSYM